MKPMVLARLLASILLLWPGWVRGDSTCGVVLSYFTTTGEASGANGDAWRVFDPARMKDDVFLSSAGGFDGVRWDTTFRVAFFRTGDSLFTVEWRLGARPKAVGKLPVTHGLQDWWFNPDSASWQAAVMLPIGQEETATRYWCELWQSSRDASAWRRIRADTVECESEDCGDWPWTDAPMGRRAPSRTLDELEAEAGPAGMFGRVAPFDTTHCSVRDEAHDEWRLLASAATPRRGLAFQVYLTDGIFFRGPFFLVDLDRRTKRRLPVAFPGEGGWFPRLVSEQCGLLMLPWSFGPSLVIDARTGRELFTTSSTADRPVWVPRPDATASRQPRGPSSPGSK